MTIYVGNTACRVAVGIRDASDIIDQLRKEMSLKPKDAYQIVQAMARRGVKGFDPTKYFISTKGEFATGLLPRVIKLLTKLGADYKIIDERVETVFRVNTIKKLDGKTLAVHQLETIEKTFDKTIGGIPYMRGIWDLAPNSGKTLTSAAFIASLDNPVVLILVDSRTIFHQHTKDYGRIFGKYFGTFSKNSNAYKNKRIVLAMVQSLITVFKKDINIKKWLKSINVLFVDEVHNFAASKDRAEVIKSVNATIKIGMSGTPFNQPDKVQRASLMALFGDTINKVTKKYLVDIGFSLIPKIIIYKSPGVLFQPNKNYKEEMHHLVHTNVEFNEMVAELAVGYMLKGKRVLIAFDIWEHGQLICECLSQYCDEYSYADGKMPTKQRVGALADFTEGKTNILVASTIVQEGWSISDISVIIYTIAGKSETMLSQFSARGERVDGQSKYFIWIDFYHQGYYNAKHFRQRLYAYREEQFAIPITFKYLCDKKGNPIFEKK